MIIERKNNYYTKLFTREYTVQYAEVCLKMKVPDNKKGILIENKKFAWYPEHGNEVFCQPTDTHNFFY